MEVDKEFSPEQIYRIAQADDLHISPFRNDGKTYGTPTWIWSVVVNNELFVRAYHGYDSSWYKAAIEQGAGRIHIDGLVIDVKYEQVDESMADAVDTAYKNKYQGSPYLGAMISTKSRGATIKIKPS